MMTIVSTTYRDSQLIKHIKSNIMLQKGSFKMVNASDSVAIRNLYHTGNYTKTALARLFGCCPDTITNVLNRSADKDVYVRTSNPDNLFIMPYRDLIREWLSKADLKIENVYQKFMGLG